MLATGTLGLGATSRRPEDITVGFVTHAQGNPFIQQIIDGAQAAAKDLGVDARTSRSRRAAQAEAQLKLVQNFVNAGAQGVATSVPGESMAKGLNELIASGVPIVQYNLLSAGGEGALCRREVGRERPRPRQDDRRQARRRRRQGHRHHRQLLPGLPGAREPRQGRRRSR